MGRNLESQILVFDECSKKLIDKNKYFGSMAKLAPILNKMEDFEPPMNRKTNNDISALHYIQNIYNKTFNACKNNLPQTMLEHGIR